MSEQALNQIIEDAASSVEMEGYQIDQQSRLWCRQLMNREITFDEYIALVKAKAEVA